MKLKLVVVDFEIPRRVRRVMTLVGVPLLVIAGVSTLALATVPHTFNSGDVLSAMDLNVDFNALDTRLAAVETKPVMTAMPDGGASYSLAAKYCGKTTATSGSISSGMLTGWQAAKDLCQTACSSSSTAHMCTGDELSRSAQLGLTLDTGWYASGSAVGFPASGNPAAFDCQGWTSNAATFVGYAQLGSVWSHSSTQDYPNAYACNYSGGWPVLCCD